MPSASADAPERWRTDAGAADVAVLDIPASAHRERVFEIDLRLVGRAAPLVAKAWQSMAVDLNGVREWSRRIEMHAPGETDTLDYHCRVVVPLGRALRVRAVTQVGAAQRLRLVIEAEEVPRP